MGEPGHAILGVASLPSDLVNYTETNTAITNDDYLNDARPIPPFEAPTATTEVKETHLTTVGYLMIGSFLAVLALCVYAIIWNVVRRRRQIAAAGGIPSGLRATKLRILRRYETVEHWIISKTVQPHDVFCAVVVSNFCHHQQRHDDTTVASKDAGCYSECPSPGVDEGDDIDPALPSPPSFPLESPSCDACTDEEECLSMNSSWNETEDDSVRECPICMSELLQGQIVSWSANELCNHVYHHECIKEWLLRHTQCCLCKHIYLPVDEKQGKAKTDALNELSRRFAAASATSYYCVETGLVRIPKTVRCTRKELQQLESRIFDGAVPPAKLVTLRGSRQEGSTCSPQGHDPCANPCAIIDLNQSSRTDDPTASNYSSVAMTASFDSSDDADEVAATMVADGFVATFVAETTSSPFTLASEDISAPRVNDSLNDVELGSAGNGSREEARLNQELVSAVDYLQQNKSSFPDNRCCIKTDDEGGVEVQETTSQMPVEDEDLSSTHLDSV
jgi:Ring finger domain